MEERCQRIIPITLAIWRVRYRGSSSKASQRRKFVRPQLNEIKLGVVAPTFHPSCGRKYKTGELWSRLAWAKIQDVSPKEPKQKGLEE
jgi:hypothetical protein